MANRGISTSAITSSMETEVITTTRIREPTSPRPPLRVSEAASRRWVSPIRRETAMPSSEARVMMPRPPIQIPTRITAWPKPDQYVPVGTVVRPVMHTADVAVKNASAKGAWWPSAVAGGLESNAVNTVTMPAKAVRVSWAGECRATLSILWRATSSGARQRIDNVARHSPAQLTLTAFAGIVTVFTALLSSPQATADGYQAPFADAFFTATSAVCITGLTTVPTGTYWSGFGQAVILVGIWIGGLGVMTLASLLGMAVSRRIGLTQRLLSASEARSGGLGEVGSLIRVVLSLIHISEPTRPY